MRSRKLAHLPHVDRAAVMEAARTVLSRPPMGLRITSTQDTGRRIIVAVTIDLKFDSEMIVTIQTYLRRGGGSVLDVGAETKGITIAEDEGENNWNVATIMSAILDELGEPTLSREIGRVFGSLATLAYSESGTCQRVTSFPNVQPASLWRAVRLAATQPPTGYKVGQVDEANYVATLGTSIGGERLDAAVIIQVYAIDKLGSILDIMSIPLKDPDRAARNKNAEIVSFLLFAILSLFPPTP